MNRCIQLFTAFTFTCCSFALATTNTPPVAQDDSATTMAGVSVEIAVTSNDTDADSDPISATVQTGPAHGSLTPITNGALTTGFTYQPDLGFTGGDTFTYTDSDGMASGNTATVSIDVGAVTGEPVQSILYIQRGPVPNAGVAGSGIPLGASWTFFGPPAVDTAGHVAFLARWRSPSGVAEGIFLGDTLVVKVGDAAPVQGGPPFKSLGQPVLNPDGSGTVAFLAHLRFETAREDGVAMTNAPLNPGDPAALRLVAQEGTVAPNAGNALFGVMKNVALMGRVVAVNATLRLHSGRPRVNSETAHGVWVYTGAATDTVLVVRAGEDVLGKKLRAFHALNFSAGTAGAGLGQLFLENGNPAIAFYGRFPLAREAELFRSAQGDGAFSVTGLSGTGEPTDPAGAIFSSYGRPALAGGPMPNVVFRGALHLGRAGVRARDNAGVFLSSGAEFSPVVREGDVVDSALVRGFARRDPVVNSQGAVACYAELQAGARTLLRSSLLYKTVAGEVRLVARAHDFAADAPAGARWRRFLSMVLPDNAAGPLFVAELEGGHGVNASNSFGLWGTTADGALHLLLRTGDTVDGLKVRSFTALSAVRGTAGAARSYNDGGTVAVRATLQGGVEGVVAVQVPGTGM